MSKPVAYRQGDYQRYLDVSKPVRVYRNLHRRCYSVMQGGIVRCYTCNVFLKNVKFIVSKAGQKRVRDEQKKNVHAFVQGYLLDDSETAVLPTYDWADVYYNPYQCEGFEDRTGQTIESAAYCEVGSPLFNDSRLYAIGQKYKDAP